MTWLDMTDPTTDRPRILTAYANNPNAPVPRVYLDPPPGFDLAVIAVGFQGNGDSTGVGLYLGTAQDYHTTPTTGPALLEWQNPTTAIAEDRGGWQFPQPLFVPFGSRMAVIWEGSVATRTYCRATLHYFEIPR